MSQLSDLATQYFSEGLSLFPLPFRAKNDKTFKWGIYQERRPTWEEVDVWFDGHPSNIAVVCGKVSGNLVVVEFDVQANFDEFNEVFTRTHNGTTIFQFTRVTKGKRGPHVWLRVMDEVVESHKFPKCEIRAEGNYIVVPPSVHPEGAEYQFLSNLPIREIATLREVGIDLKQAQTQGHNPPGWVSQLLLGVGEGGRNDAAIRLAGYFRNLVPVDVTERLLADWNAKNAPPLPMQELDTVIRQAYKYPEREKSPHTPHDIKDINTYIDSIAPILEGVSGTKVSGGDEVSVQNSNEISNDSETVDPKRYKSVSQNVTKAFPLTDRITEWIRGTSSWWTTEDLDRDLGLSSPTLKNNRRLILFRLKEQGVIEPHEKINKQFRFVNTKITSLNFKGAQTTGVLSIKWPLGIEKYVNLFPGNMAVIAGSPNAGKTALMLNFIYLNQNDFPIYYFCSEMGEVELRDRLDKFPGMDINDWKFEAIERAGDFADVIRPDCVNVIDFLEMTTELYTINTHLTAITHKLGTGVAIVAVQKKLGAQYGRGQEFGLEKPKLYVSLDKGSIQIVKGKSWAQKNVDPNNLRRSFKIVNGCEFKPISEWDWPRQ